MVSIGPDADTDGFELANGWNRGDVSFIALRGSQCRETVDSDDGDERRCSNQARYMMLSDDSVAGFCGQHVPDLWVDTVGGPVDIGEGVWDAHDCECDTEKQSRPNPKPGARFDLDVDSHAEAVQTGDQIDDPDPQAHDSAKCGSQAALLIIDKSGHENFYCRRHAMPVWFSYLDLDDRTTREPTNKDETEAEAETEPETEAEA